MDLDQVEINPKNSNLKILSLNCLGLSNKLDTIKDLILDKDADVVLLQETWCYNLDHFNLLGYKNIFVSSMDENIRS